MTKPDASPSRKILLIDTTSRDETRSALIDKKEAVTLARAVRAQALQAMLRELLTKTGTELSDLTTVAVLTGPGSFTGTRIGITAANTIGYLQKVPLVALANIDFDAAITLLESGKLPEAQRVIAPTA